MNFVAIDFETANWQKDSACAVGIISVKDGRIEEEYYSLIQPPNNLYNYHNTKVHGITAEQTRYSPTFEDIYPKVKKILFGRKMVAHNESFDRNVLFHTMETYGLSYSELEIASKWECTVKIFRKKKQYPVNLAACCARYNIDLTHHNALSDALACAKLYMIDQQPLFAKI